MYIWGKISASCVEKVLLESVYYSLELNETLNILYSLCLFKNLLDDPKVRFEILLYETVSVSIAEE